MEPLSSHPDPADPRSAALGRKSLRPMSAPMAEAAGSPDALFAWEGERLRDLGFTPLSAVLRRPMNILNLDGEVPIRACYIPVK
jgi:hypothetical protein